MISISVDLTPTIPDGDSAPEKSSTASTSKPVPVLDSPCSVASDGSSTNWNGIPRVRRKWIDVVEGMYKHNYKIKVCVLLDRYVEI